MSAEEFWDEDLVIDDDSDSETVYGDVQDDGIDNLDIADFDSSDIEVIAIDDNLPNAPSSNPDPRSGPDRRPTSFRQSVRTPSISLPNLGIPSYKLNANTSIRVGDTVELKDILDRPPNANHSGDFLRVKSIILNLQTDDIRLRGYRLRRTKYHGQYFNRKLNELVMLLRVSENDPRPAFVQGLEEISIHEIIRTRDCIISSKPYPMQSFRDGPPSYFPRSMTKEERTHTKFDRFILVCRYVHIEVIEDNSKSYSGEARAIYDRESDSPSYPASSDTTPIFIDSGSESDSDEDVTVNIPQRVTQIRKRRSEFSKELDGKSSKQRANCPVKMVRYMFADVFCGAGGASQGAVQADLQVLWGLEKNKLAIQAYKCNHAGAKTFLMDAHDFPSSNIAKNLLQVDILHLSPPCCTWSPAHTIPGRNDQANHEAIYTVGAILKKVKPRIATLEQTFGLVTIKEHRKNFRLLINDIINAGYNIRYKVQDISDFGLAQQRKRLLLIAARRGRPLPPFPKATHGPPGSGLRRYTSVNDALDPLIRESRYNRFVDDYHRPEDMRRLNKPPYNPHTNFLKGCITSSGGQNYHYSGKRCYTPREKAFFQGFSHDYVFTGSNSEATKQIGNAFPPIMGEPLYRSCAQTLEAFDHGLVESDADIADIHEYLAERGYTLPPKNPFRYLFHSDRRTSFAVPSSSSAIPGTLAKKPSVFSRKVNIGPRPEVQRSELEDCFGAIRGVASVSTFPTGSMRKKRKMAPADRRKFEQAEARGDLLTLDDSDSG